MVNILADPLPGCLSYRRFGWLLTGKQWKSRSTFYQVSETTPYVAPFWFQKLKFLLLYLTLYLFLLYMKLNPSCVILKVVLGYKKQIYNICQTIYFHVPLLSACRRLNRHSHCFYAERWYLDVYQEENQYLSKFE